MIFKIKPAFTLIELLVVISIIALLASVVLVGLNKARIKARDARRVADLNQMAKALEFYALTHGENYPPDAAAACDTSKGLTTWGPPDWSCYPLPTGNYWDANWLGSLDKDLIASLAVDPLNKDSYFYYYEPVTAGQFTQFGIFCPSTVCAYILSAKLEDSNSQYANPGCNGCQPDHDFCVSGGGAQLGVSC